MKINISYTWCRLDFWKRGKKWWIRLKRVLKAGKNRIKIFPFPVPASFLMQPLHTHEELPPTPCISSPVRRSKEAVRPYPLSRGSTHSSLNKSHHASQSSKFSPPIWSWVNFETFRGFSLDLCQNRVNIKLLATYYKRKASGEEGEEEGEEEEGEGGEGEGGACPSCQE